MEKQALLNTYINNVTMPETIAAIEKMIADGKKSYVVAINVDVVMKIENDSYLKQVVDNAQRWMIKLQKEGKGYSTLTSIRGVVKPAFQMAYNEEVVRRNPFDFKLTDVVVNDSQKRISLTEKQQKVWMNFIREDKSYAKYYDEFVVLLGTGMTTLRNR